MNLNNLMHTRNIYKDNPPDFKDLAQKYPYFKSHSRENTNGHVIIDFKNPQALRALLYTLLENDFNIKIEIPLDRLIPTLPLRLNYIHWIEDLVNCLGEVDTVTGIDIGTGASCIYPLLGTKLNGWKFLATEVDESSARYAQDNVKRNHFTDNITVQLVNCNDYLIKPLEDTNIKKATFCMCNPPFFSSEDEAILGASRTDKRPVPISVSTGSASETVTTGGEVEFVKGIIRDSLKLQLKVSWYSSMFGKKSSMKAVVAYLKENKVPTVVTTQFCQGKTMRWGVAWTFLPGITTDTVMGPALKKQKKESKALSFTIPTDSPVLSCKEDNSMFEEAVKLMDNILEDLKVTIDDRHRGNKVCQWQGSASEITWSNQRQKRRKQRLKDESETNSPRNTESAVCKHDSEANTDIKENVQHRLTCYEISDKQEVGMKRKHKDSCDNDKAEHSEKKTIVAGVNTLDVQALGADLPLCTFQVCVVNNSENDLQVQVQCIRADNKNHVYQLYQFLQNKIVRGL